MKLTWGRRAGAGLAVAAGSIALVTFAASPALASPLFCGAGRGRTVAVAIQSAFWDAKNTAQSEGFYGDCTIVGQPAIFETANDPNFGHIFRASLNVSCQP
jgi:hypothetical protein